MGGAPPAPGGNDGGGGDAVELLAAELGGHVGDGLAHAVGELTEDVARAAAAFRRLRERGR